MSSINNRYHNNEIISYVIKDDTFINETTTPANTLPLKVQEVPKPRGLSKKTFINYTFLPCTVLVVFGSSSSFQGTKHQLLC